MRVLVTGGGSRFAQQMMAALQGEFSFRVTDRELSADVSPEIERREGDLRDPDFAQAAVEGMDTVLHLAPLSREGDDLTRLDNASRGTYLLLKAALDAGVKRLVLGSTLALFDRIPTRWRLNEEWRPFPQPTVGHLAPWIAELGVREGGRGQSLQSICLRLGQWDEETLEGSPAPRQISLSDAVDAVRWALKHQYDTGRERSWRVVHRETERLRQSTASAEVSDWKVVFAPSQPIPSRPLRNVVIFGAGGPVGAELAGELESSYRLRLTDVRPLEEIAREGKRQSEGAPLPVPLPSPHENRVVDVADPRAVDAACEGMDAIINCSVVREETEAAFRVNTLGVYNMARAAVRHRIRRFVQTGPQLLSGPGGYHWDYDVSDDVPPRPGLSLYAYSKYLGQEIGRVFADTYDLEIPTLLFTAFVNPEAAGDYVHSFSVTWRDSARAIRRALEVTSLPSPYEVIHVMTDLPHRRYDTRKAKALLGWEPRDTLESLWNPDTG